MRVQNWQLAYHCMLVFWWKEIGLLAVHCSFFPHNLFPFWSDDSCLWNFLDQWCDFLLKTKAVCQLRLGEMLEHVQPDGGCLLYLDCVEI